MLIVVLCLDLVIENVGVYGVGCVVMQCFENMELFFVQYYCEGMLLVVVLNFNSNGQNLIIFIKFK